MSLEVKSFFDDSEYQKNKKIWEKVNANKQDQKNLNPCVATEFFKMTKKRDYKKFKRRYLMIEDNVLYVSKSEQKTKITGQLNLNICKCEFQQLKFKEKLKGLDTSELFGFRLTRNGRVLEVYTEFEELFQQWRERLSMRVFQTTFHDEFQVTKMIGKGSFAKVYLATKKDGGQKYAIKAFNKEYISMQHKGKESLINEIKIMRNLDSDYCLRLYETYETTNSVYFVVDLLQGGELLNQVRQEGKFTIKEVMQIMRNLLRALHHLHSRGVMHRDLKPENILMRTKSSNYDIVLADFGLATFVKEENILFKRCGTPGYVAPEILLYNETDPIYGTKCDIFSAGVIFYLILTGKQPFTGKDYKDILRANKTCKIDFEIEQLKNANQDAIDLMKKMMKADPNERIDATQCLQHKFFYSEVTSDLEINIQEGLGQYDVEYKKGLKNKAETDSQEKVGSLALKTNSHQLLTGNTDTMDKLGSSDFGTPKNNMRNSQKNNEKSKFSHYVSQDSGSDSPSNSSQIDQEVKAYTDKPNKDLRKIAIKNSMQTSQTSQQKGIIQNNNDEDDDDYDVADEEISDEGTPSDRIDQGLKNMNFEGMIKHQDESKLSKFSKQKTSNND